MKKFYLFLALITISVLLSAQGLVSFPRNSGTSPLENTSGYFKVVKGKLSLLKGEKNFNIRFDYDGMVVEKEAYRGAVY